MSRGRWGRTIKVRLVRNVALVMLVVLATSSGFVYSRVQHALDRQLNRDLGSYEDVVEQAVGGGTTVPSGTSGQSYQVFGTDGAVVVGSGRTPAARLLTAMELNTTRTEGAVRADHGRMIPPARHPFRVRASIVPVAGERLVVATAISRHPRDEALRELLLQLLIADLLVLLAASYVGYRTARGALDPVERYRVAATVAEGSAGTRLPVDEDRDDELTRLGHTLNDLLAGLEASARREHQFIADASHELRTPLALLKAEVELALHRPRSAEASRGVLRSVSGQVDRMVELSNALLDLEELASGTAAHLEDVDVRALLETVASRFERAFAAEHRKLVVDSDELSAPLSERWVDAALSNLVVNGLRHGAGTVTLAATTGGRDLLLSVADEGSGFEDGFGESAFDRFSRADVARATPGSGLGLALVRAAAQAHGGTATIGGDGAPSSVTLRIPLPPEGESVVH